MIRPGYRYPVFETFENSIYKFGSLYKHFNTAFYYPLTEQCYLADDPENRIIRDRLAMLDERAFKQESNDLLVEELCLKTLQQRQQH